MLGTVLESTLGMFETAHSFWELHFRVTWMNPWINIGAVHVQQSCYNLLKPGGRMYVADLCRVSPLTVKERHDMRNELYCYELASNEELGKGWLGGWVVVCSLFCWFFVGSLLVLCWFFVGWFVVDQLYHI